jgi:peptidyl-prolyl cis-trans isomerase SurA
MKTLAALYSDDPGSKEKAGQYDLNRNEKQWDPAFLAKAFSLKEGHLVPSNRNLDTTSFKW